MYKSAAQYLGPDANHLMDPYQRNQKTYISKKYQIPPQQLQPPSHYYQPPQQLQPPSHYYQPPQQPQPPSYKPPPQQETKQTTRPMIKMETKKYTRISDPRVWGPAFWFSLHASALHYPEHPSPIFRERIKQRILAIPYEIPCPGCKPHAHAFIEQYKHSLDDIVSSRDKLFNFYVDFHNKVNQRYNKKIWTYDEAKKYYSQGADVTIMKY